jgi:thiol-disulfide isomerase/thioredoxin
MIETVFIRLGLTILLGFFGLGLTKWSRHIQLKQARGKVNLLAGLLHPARSSIVYFSSPDCLPCRVVHKPAMTRLKAESGNHVDFIEINVYENPDLAKAWGVLSVPTTFILDKSGNPVISMTGALTYDQIKNRLMISNLI